MASVYWFPPKEMSRQKIVLPPERTLTLVTEAPMLTSADDAAGLDGVIRSRKAFWSGEGVHVHEDRGLARLRDHARVVADLVLLDGDQEDVHRLARRRAPGRRSPGSRR